MQRDPPRLSHPSFPPQVAAGISLAERSSPRFCLATGHREQALRAVEDRDDQVPHGDQDVDDERPQRYDEQVERPQRFPAPEKSKQDEQQTPGIQEAGRAGGIDELPPTGLHFVGAERLGRLERRQESTTWRENIRSTGKTSQARGDRNPFLSLFIQCRAHSFNLARADAGEKDGR